MIEVCLLWLTLCQTYLQPLPYSIWEFRRGSCHLDGDKLPIRRCVWSTVTSSHNLFQKSTSLRIETNAIAAVYPPIATTDGRTQCVCSVCTEATNVLIHVRRWTSIDEEDVLTIFGNKVAAARIEEASSRTFAGIAKRKPTRNCDWAERVGVAPVREMDSLAIREGALLLAYQQTLKLRILDRITEDSNEVQRICKSEMPQLISVLQIVVAAKELHAAIMMRVHVPLQLCR